LVSNLLITKEAPLVIPAVATTQVAEEKRKFVVVFLFLEYFFFSHMEYM